MQQLNLEVGEIKEHGFLGASLLFVMRELNLRTAEKMADVLFFESPRALHNELTRLKNRGAINYDRTAAGISMAFLKVVK